MSEKPNVFVHSELATASSKEAAESAEADLKVSDPRPADAEEVMKQLLQKDQ